MWKDDILNKNNKTNKQLLKQEIKDNLAIFEQLQMKLKENNKGLIIVIDGWGTVGKGTLINKLIDVLDTKFYKVENMLPPTKEEMRKPFLTRYFKKIPEIGEITIFNSSWLSDLARLKAKNKIDNKTYKNMIESINIFEKQLIDNNYILVKLFLNIDQKAQRKRIKNLLSSKDTAWRVSNTDIFENDNFSDYKDIITNIIEKTNHEMCGWNIIDVNKKKTTLLKSLQIINNIVENRFNVKYIPSINLDERVKLNPTIKVENVDLNKSISNDEYKKKLKSLQKELNELHNKLYQKKIPVIIAYEGWDAAGKGGNIKRISKSLDPRGFEIFPIASPTQEEKNRHFLWRFYNKLPKSGHIAIFDRTWYGRVMVERLEEFCSENDWQRAFNEINLFEYELNKYGALVIKFWIQIDKDTQLERFNARQNTPEKRWKITDEDWRNREKWDEYEVAINEMIEKTNTTYAPWYIIESNDKKYARIKTLEILIKTIKNKLETC